jgi:hypothetical protein
MQYEYDKKDAIARAVQEKKDEVVRQEVQKQKLLRNSFVAGFALMLALAAVSYRSYVRKRKDNLLIEKQKLLVEEKNNGNYTESSICAAHTGCGFAITYKHIDTLLERLFYIYICQKTLSVAISTVSYQITVNCWWLQPIVPDMVLQVLL